MDISNVVNENCSGIGCCQIDIPQNLTDIILQAYSFKNHTQVWKFNPCSFAFIIKEDEFIFSSDYLTSLRNNKTLPMVLDWAIDAETCEVTQNTENYICGGNSTCIDLKNRSRYRCQCRGGYRGNPYLKDGCQGIQYIYISTTNFFNQGKKNNETHFNEFLIFIYIKRIQKVSYCFFFWSKIPLK